MIYVFNEELNYVEILDDYDNYVFVKILYLLFMKLILWLKN